jgi:hypothetical protein
VGFVVADENDPLGPTGVRVANFFIFSNFGLVFYTDNKDAPRNRICKKISLENGCGSGLAPAPQHVQ